MRNRNWLPIPMWKPSDRLVVPAGLKMTMSVASVAAFRLDRRIHSALMLVRLSICAKAADTNTVLNSHTESTIRLKFIESPFS
ncbi:MAG: hypothetical protein BWX71_02027 [Deltaproteobacteria bacterium ADurb.Bin072]|nr:MAG: hypothetical protein BWX71_02027 [Deltaproteobacteria bacterium ADurb.Bin072]